MSRKNRTELIAGLTTFFTMAYIVVVNPAILSTPGTGISLSGALTATVLLAFSMTLLMGLYARLPFGVAPGMGLNAFFTFSIVLGQKIPWPTAFGMVFWAGIFFAIISFTPLREKLAMAIPESIRLGSAAGIGLFLTFIGFKNMGLVVGDSATLVRVGTLTPEVLMALSGLLTTLFLVRRKNPLAFLIAIFQVTLLAALFGKIQKPTAIFSLPNFSDVFLQLDIWGALKWAYLPTIFAIVFTDFFDSISTFVGLSYAGGLVDAQGQPRNLRQGLAVDAFATLFAGVFGTSSGTAYIESASGIEVGGRTGLTAVVTALCFLPCFFIAPLAAMVPAYATGPVLVVVGFLMFRCIGRLSFEKIEEAVPAFLGIILTPLTFSITQGILWSIVGYVVLHLIMGEIKKLSPTLILIALSCLLILMLPG